MGTNGQITLTLLHDLALLYLGLAHGADEDLDPAETHAIAAKLRQWQPDKDPALIDHVIREATLSYLNGPKTNRLQDAITTIRDNLSEQQRITILQDLNEIARADGTVLSEESDFIRHIADVWEVDTNQDSPS